MRHALHRALRADRHERRRLDVAVRGRHARRAARAPSVCVTRKLKDDMASDCGQLVITDLQSSVSLSHGGRMPDNQMTVKKLRVGVIYGGRSGEHEVSLASAAAVVRRTSTRSATSRPDPDREGRPLDAADRPPTLISAADVIAASRANDGARAGRGRAKRTSSRIPATTR